MNKSVIYIVGATVLVGGAYLFLKNKKAKDLAKLNEIGGATTGGATTGGATTGGATTGGATTGGTTSGGTTSSLSNTSDGVTPSDANLNLANATVLVGQRANLVKSANKSCITLNFSGNSYAYFFGSGIYSSNSFASNSNSNCVASRNFAKKQLVELDKKLATLGYKVDATGTLVKI